MQVIAFASQKGGAGKTTLAGHIAVEAERVGRGPVALLDADPQGSLADWWNERTADTPVFVRTGIDRLRADIDELRTMGFELLVIDTPPAITSTIATVMGLSDLVITPTRPSPHDLRSVVRTVELAERLNKPQIFVVNGASAHARITIDMAIALSQHGTLAPAIIHQRADFASSMIDGRTVMEVPRKSASSDEIRRLWTYIDERLQRLQRRPMPPPLSTYTYDVQRPEERVL